MYKTLESLNKLSMFLENIFLGSSWRLSNAQKQNASIFFTLNPFILSKIDLYVLCIVVGFVIWVYQILTQPAHSPIPARLWQAKSRK